MLQVPAVIAHQPLEVVQLDIVLFRHLRLLCHDEIRGIQEPSRRQPHVDDFREEIVALIADFAVGLVDGHPEVKHVLEQRERHLARRCPRCGLHRIVRRHTRLPARFGARAL
ncbi:hypothetical protein D3C72_1367500 [compost metagenome]